MCALFNYQTLVESGFGNEDNIDRDKYELKLEGQDLCYKYSQKDFVRNARGVWRDCGDPNSRHFDFSSANRLSIDGNPMLVSDLMTHRDQFTGTYAGTKEDRYYLPPIKYWADASFNPGNIEEETVNDGEVYSNMAADQGD